VTRRIGRQISGGISSFGRKEPNLAEFAAELKSKQPQKTGEIDVYVSDLESQMATGGIALQEAQVALLTAFPSLSKTKRRPFRSGKGGSGKR
jgi:hypothetical protein